MASIRFERVSKSYPDGPVALRDLELEIRDGELVVLVGPSGCGKTTALRILSGLETPTSGRVHVGDADVTDQAPQCRDVAMVFQNDALYPHLTVRENLGFGLRMRGTRRERIQERVNDAARSLGLVELQDRIPAQLSGGQRQRVALGRAIVRQPKAFLLDEPLANLDARSRVELRMELARVHRKLRSTMLYVTHDQEEAMTLGERVAVIRDGVIQQVAAPTTLYDEPCNAFVASFIGSPPMNFLQAIVRTDADGIRVCGRDFSLPLDPRVTLHDATAVVLGVRPRDLELIPPSAGEFRGRVDFVERPGGECLVHLTVDERDDQHTVVVVCAPERAGATNDIVGVRIRRDRLHVFDAKTSSAIHHSK